MGARSWSERRRQPPPAQPPGPGTPQPHNTQHKQQQHYGALSPQEPAMNTSALYTPSTVQERQRLESGAFRDRQVRMQSVQADLLLDLPHPVALPDGEESCKVKILHLRGCEEIYRGYIRPPPNRTIWEGSRPPPPPPYHAATHHRSASATNIKSVRESNSKHQRASYPQGATTTVTTTRLSRRHGPGGGAGVCPTVSVEYSDPPPCYSDVISSPEYHRTATGILSNQKSEL